MIFRARRRRADDRGATLVELIVYIALGALVLALIASLFAAGVRSQAAAAERDAATGKAALITGSLQSSIRNASAFRVEPDGRTLRARVATGTASWECQAWTLTAGGDFRFTTSPYAIRIRTIPGWTTVASGVATADGGPLFVRSGARVTYELVVTDQDQILPLSGGVTAQAVLEGSGACW